MKYLTKILTFIILFVPFGVYAAPSGSASCSSAGSVTVGNTITVTVTGSSSSAIWETFLSYDSSKLQFVSGNDVHDINTDFKTSITYKYTFKAIAPGSAYVRTNSNISDGDGNKAPSSITSSCSINVSEQSYNYSSNSNSNNNSSSNKVSPKTNSNSSKTNDNSNKNNNSLSSSSDNSIKSIKIEGLDLNPEFNPEKLDYTATLKSDEDNPTIDINCNLSDSKAKIEGNGKRELHIGNNIIELVVTAENGSKKTYKIEVVVTEKNPLEVKVKKDSYNVIRKLDGVEIPEGFEKTTIKLNDKDVEALINKDLGLTLVYLTDKDGNASFFVYDEKANKFYKYNYIKSIPVNLLLLDSDKNRVKGFKKKELHILGYKVIGFEFKKNKDYYLVYALNLNTNKKGYYLYDKKENTFQRYLEMSDEIDPSLIKNAKIGVVIAGGVFLILFMSLIMSMNRNRKNKKRINEINKRFQ